MRVSWTRLHGLAVLTATVIVLQGTSTVSAQYMQYSNTSQPQTQGYSAGQSWQGYGSQPQAQSYSGYSAQPQSQWQGQGAGQQVVPGYGAQQQAVPQYVAMAQTVASQEDQLESIAQTAPAPVSSTSCNCQAQAAPAMYQGSCDNGCNAYNTFDHGCGYGCCQYDCRGYGNACGSGCLQGADGCGCGHRWFGGVYGLLMERDNGNRVPLAFTTSTANAPPYYPTDAEIALTTRNVEIDYQGGLEFRLGAYFGGGKRGYGAARCDTCGTGSCGCCGPTHAWEVGYWGIFEDDESDDIDDITGDGFRTYSMMDFRGLEYSPTGLVADYRSVNVWFDYGPPTVDNTAPYDVEVRSFTARSTFSAQNLEANLLRLPVLCGGGCGCCPPRYEVTTLFGTRFLRIDEDFMLRSDYERMDTNALGFLAYNVQVDNKLYGVQLGCNGIYRLGCTGRFAVHCSSVVGVYGNDIEVEQRIDTPVGGVVRYANGTNDDFEFESDKDDVSVLGELRLGGSYQVNCNWRLYGGWRVIGITGVALATDQIPTAFITPDQVGTVASSGSMILHGLQAGTEFTY